MLREPLPHCHITVVHEIMVQEESPQRVIATPTGDNDAGSPIHHAKYEITAYSSRYSD